MRLSADFAATVRDGVRSRSGVVVVHRLLGADAESADPALVGLVVGRGVGNSVVRHRVSRRLRAQLTVRLDAFAPGTRTVVRALPDAGAVDSHRLGRQLDTALGGLARSSARRERSGP